MIFGHVRNLACPLSGSHVVEAMPRVDSPRSERFYSQRLPEIAKRESEKAVVTQHVMWRENKEARCQVGHAVATANVPLLFPQ